MIPLRLYLSEGRIVAEFTVFVENRSGRERDMEELIARGIRRMEGVYRLGEAEEELAVRLGFAEEFSLGAVNVRVIDRTPEERRFWHRNYNVSRAYFGSRRRGVYKLFRYVFRRPDVFINLKGRDPEDEESVGIICSVVQHEFGHVLGLRDQYKRKSFKKRHEGVDDRDLMYRTGHGQRFMGYQIQRIRGFAARERLPFRNG